MNITKLTNLPEHLHFMVAVDTVAADIILPANYGAHGDKMEVHNPNANLPHGKVIAHLVRDESNIPVDLQFKVQFESHFDGRWNHIDIIVPASACRLPDSSLYPAHRKHCLGRAMKAHIDYFVNSELTNTEEFIGYMQDVPEAGDDKLMYWATTCICFSIEGLI